MTAQLLATKVTTVLYKKHTHTVCEAVATEQELLLGNVYIKITSSRTIIPVIAHFSRGFWPAMCTLLFANHGNQQLPTIHILAFDSIEFVLKKKTSSAWPQVIPLHITTLVA